MKKWWFRLLPYARHEKTGVFVILLLLFAGVVVQSAYALAVVKLIIDYVLAESDLPNSISFLMLVPGAGSTTGLLAWLSAGTVILFVADPCAPLRFVSMCKQASANRMAYHLG